jgi:hypothetical protein
LEEFRRKPNRQTNRLIREFEIGVRELEAAAETGKAGN